MSDEALRAQIKDIEHAARMTQVAGELAMQFGCSVKEATDSLQACIAVLGTDRFAKPQFSGQRVSIGIEEYTQLQRVSHMAAQALPVLRARPDKTAVYTALRNALTALQIMEGSGTQPLPGEEQVRDLVDLLDDLGEGPSASESP